MKSTFEGLVEQGEALIILVHGAGNLAKGVDQVGEAVQGHHGVEEKALLVLAAHHPVPAHAVHTTAHTVAPHATVPTIGATVAAAVAPIAAPHSITAAHPIAYTSVPTSQAARGCRTETCT